MLKKRNIEQWLDERENVYIWLKCVIWNVRHRKLDGETILDWKEKGNENIQTSGEISSWFLNDSKMCRDKRPLRENKKDLHFSSCEINNLILPVRACLVLNASAFCVTYATNEHMNRAEKTSPYTYNPYRPMLFYSMAFFVMFISFSVGFSFICEATQFEWWIPD